MCGVFKKKLKIRLTLSFCFQIFLNFYNLDSLISLSKKVVDQDDKPNNCLRQCTVQ